MTLHPARPSARTAGTTSSSRPTFGAAARRLEVHVFEFAGDLYGRRLVVGLRDHLRPERRFSGVDELVAQIRADATDARTRLAG